MEETSVIRGFHSLARRYCMTKSKYWGRKYSKLMRQGRDREEDGFHYTFDAKRLYPRYVVLGAILPELEKYTPDEFDCLTDAKSKVFKIIHEAVSLLTIANDEDDITRNTMAEERRNFIAYLEKASRKKLIKEPALFYRRKLTASESDLLWAQLNMKWGIEKRGQWIPLDGSESKQVIAFMDDYFESEVGFDLLRKLLNEHGVNYVYELRELESSPEYELEISAFSPTYGLNGEGIWCSKEMEWVIYASHENSITFGGESLVNKVKGAWSNWESRLWLDWRERLERGL